MKAYELAAENKGMREEIERLRHDIERHIAIASGLATENERLRAELAACQQDAERYRWLTYDHDDAEQRKRCREIWDLSLIHI